ncbi:hypothetical protein J1P26_05785 [Neobacillus sp. MM2021_6]|uniref:hypothetical protein n=1 Tax=Bacillaceae TaxID=186817 RepID=UPI001407DC92|nr:MULTISPECIES: hypothetical protein [Bacillaceae]MBO0959238.1 hypothetical protein [Neobacillus sp. MM2021_6]NHC16843.1 hypothetical protein [Bacillus sp. MM2020_4]
MVTAIVIPIICLYFYWLTRKEMKEQDVKWLNVGNIPHEAVITGEIKDIVEERQRFYYHRYIFVQTLKLQTEAKIINAKMITPIKKNVKADSFIIGDVIRVYGSWEGSTILFNHYEKKKITNNEKR